MYNITKFKFVLRGVYDDDDGETVKNYVIFFVGLHDYTPADLVFYI